MPTLQDLITDACARSRDARRAYERAAFEVDMSDEQQVARLTVLKGRAEMANDELNGYLNQVPRVRA